LTLLLSPQRPASKSRSVRRQRVRNCDRGLCVSATTRAIGMLVFAGTPAPGMLLGQVVSLDTIGRVRIVVSERGVGLGRAQALVLAMETLRQYSCLGFGIDHSFQ